MFHRETDAAKVARNREAIFDLHAAALDWLERYTGIPYPFGKFDFVLMPSFQFGGMEHPGSIFYNASSLLLDPSATTNQKLGRASLIAHETAHMWFGDLVTMRWFDDVWMKEVFANFMAAKIVNPSFPEINHELRFLYAHYPAAYDVDRTEGTNAIRQPLDNLNEAGSLYGAIIYQKAPIVMRQLEMIVAPDGLRDGLRDYLKQHAFGNASWPDLIALLDRRTPEDLAAWSRAWVEEAGRPDDRRPSVASGRPGVPPAGPGRRPRAAVGAAAEGGARTSGARPSCATVALRAEPATVSRRNGERRHARTTTSFRPAAASATAISSSTSRTRVLSDRAPRRHRRSADARRGARHALGRDARRPGRAARAVHDARPTALPRETRRADRPAHARLHAAGVLEVSARRTTADREAPALERLLRARARRRRDREPEVRLVQCAARRRRAASDTLGWLERVWKTTETVPGLTLAEPDFITLALELAVRERAGLAADPRRAIGADSEPRPQGAVRVRQAGALGRCRDARRVLRQPARREEPPPRGLGAPGARLPASPAARRRRPRSTSAPSLELLREIQRTGDIFFPKRWMDATLSGHQSASAARVVSEFLERLPEEYPERLRRVILSSADDLMRVRRIRER